MKSHTLFKKAIVTMIVSFLIVSLVAGLGSSFSISRVDVDDASSFWLSLAGNAWNYFQPGIGVDPTTGLHRGGVNYFAFTDWDTGLYIQAIIDAEKLGILNRTGAWGTNERINKILTFLETRPLTSDDLPYLSYSSQTGKNIDDTPQVATDIGKLLVALKNLETYKPELKNRIDSIVYNRTNYEQRRISVDVLLGQMLNGTRQANIYDYYVTLGFAGFWPEKYTSKADAILDFITSADKVDYLGIALPRAKVSCDPLLYAIFDFQQPDARIVNLTRQVYLAHEARFNSTGRYVAFGETNTDFSDVSFVYQWVVMPDGRTWVLEVVEPNDVNNHEVSVMPIVCLKVAVGFLAIYASPFAQGMVNYVLGQLPAPATGYNVGVDENGRVVDASLGAGNSLIISAARYGIDHNITVAFYSVSTPSSSSTPAVTNPPTPGTSPKPTTMPNPTTIPAPSVNPTPNPNPPQIPTTQHKNDISVVTASTAAIAVIVMAGVLVHKKQKVT